MYPPDGMHLPVAETVLVFGETLIDQFSDRAVLGGAPFNVACHLAALGTHPVLVTRVGKDAPGDLVTQTMVERGLDLQGIQVDPSRQTGRVHVVETESGHVFDILTDQAYDYIHAGMARRAAMSARPGLVYFGTLAQRGESRRALSDMLSAVETCAFLDVNLRDPWVEPEVVRWSLQQASVVKMNEDELTRLCTLFSLGGSNPENSAAALLASFDLQRIVITRGQAGAWTLDCAGRRVDVAARPLAQLVDTVGAGDGFAAIFMLGMIRNWPIEMQMARADAFARAICGIRGAVPAAPAFYAPFLRDWELNQGVGRA